MIDNILNVLTQLGPGAWSLIIGVIGVIGGILAVVSGNGIGKESKILKNASSTLKAEDAWVGSSPKSKVGLDKWLREKRIVEDSHVGDFIEACWSSQQGGRTATLSELHALVPRRQRSYWPVRLSGGIAALLLVMGIVGTLASIHPILDEFKFEITKAGALPVEEKADVPEIDSTPEDVVDSVGKVNMLINGLGDAFKPSLMALFFTVLVVSCRGGYSIKLYKFSKDLDQFATGVLIPNYRATSLAKQYEDVKKSLVGVADSILDRESRFEDAVEKMSGFLVGLPLAIEQLTKTTENSNQAAKNLATASESVSASLTNNLGEHSPLYQSIANLDGVYTRTEETLKSFNSLVKGVQKSNEDSRASLSSAIKNLENSAEVLGDEQINGRIEVGKSIDLLNSTMVAVPEKIKKETSEAIEGSVKVLNEKLDKLGEDIKDEHQKTTKQLKKQMDTAVDKVDQVVGSLDTVGTSLDVISRRVEGAADALSGIPGVVAGVAKDSVDQGVVEFKKSLVVLGEDMKKTHRETADELKKQTAKSIDRIENVAAILPGEVSKIQTATDELKNVPDSIQGKLEQAEARMQDVMPEIVEGIKKTASQSVDEQVKKLDVPIENIKKLSEVGLKGGSACQYRRRGLWSRVGALFSKNKNS